MTTEYGSRLKLARTTANLTQAKLSKMTGIAQSTISTAEREGHGSGETPVYAQACGVNALWLATGEGVMLEFGPNQGPAQSAPAQGAININRNPHNAVQAANVVAGLAALLVNVDPGRRASIVGTLSDLVQNPADTALQNALISFLADKTFAKFQERQA